MPISVTISRKSVTEVVVLPEEYVVYVKFWVGGFVRDRDVLGALFNLTEGLLGDGKGLRELHKSKRISWIEVSINPVNGRSRGLLKITCKLSREETALVAAAIEAVDRVSRFDARFAVSRIESVADEKRRRVRRRALELLQTIREGR